MEELQIAKLPSNFKVYEIDDYHAINCDKEAKNFLDIINEAKKENDVQRYIKSNQKWFIPLSILKHMILDIIFHVLYQNFSLDHSTDWIIYW